MELKEFVAESIKQIVDGLVEANEYILEKTNSSEGVRSDYKKINFDVAVTTNEGEKDKLGGGIFIAQVFKAGVSSELTSVTSNTSRINFEVLVNTKMKTE